MPLRRLATTALLGLLATHAGAAAPALPAPWLPIDPGTARCRIDGQEIALRNRALRLEFAARDGVLAPAAFGNGFTRAPHALAGELFSVTTRAKQRVPASRFRLAGALTCDVLVARPDAARAAERRRGVVLSARLRDATTGLQASWRATLRDGADYVREELRLESDADIDLAQIALLELAGQPAIVPLAPFQVLVWELAPAP